MNRAQFIAALGSLRPSSTFLSLIGYRNEYSEIADYNIVFHISYESALKKSISVLEGLDFSEPLQLEAKSQLLNSFNRSLLKLSSTPEEEMEDNYVGFKNVDGEYIKGIKLHSKTNNIHLYGLVVHKRVIMPGFPYPTRASSELTVLKNKLRLLTPVSKYRQFRILPSQVDSISVGKLSLLPPG